VLVCARVHWFVVDHVVCELSKTEIVNGEILGFRHLATLGEYAYHMYVLQYPVFTAIRKWRHGNSVTYERVPLNEWTFNVVVVIFVSYFLCDWLEMPYVRMLKKVCDHVSVGMYGEKKKVDVILRTRSLGKTITVEREDTPLPMSENVKINEWPAPVDNSDRQNGMYAPVSQH